MPRKEKRKLEAKVNKLRAIYRKRQLETGRGGRHAWLMRDPYSQDFNDLIKGKKTVADLKPKARKIIMEADLDYE